MHAILNALKIPKENQYFQKINIYFIVPVKNAKCSYMHYLNTMYCLNTTCPRSHQLMVLWVLVHLSKLMYMGVPRNTSWHKAILAMTGRVVELNQTTHIYYTIYILIYLYKYLFSFIFIIYHLFIYNLIYMYIIYIYMYIYTYIYVYI